MPRTGNIEQQFYDALSRIKAYRSPEWLRRNAEKQYGLSYEEALEMAYENVLNEAHNALIGYRKPRAKKAKTAETSVAHAAAGEARS